MIIIYDFSLTSFHEISKKCHILSEIEYIILRKICIWDLLKFLFLVTFFLPVYTYMCSAMSYCYMLLWHPSLNMQGLSLINCKKFKFICECSLVQKQFMIQTTNVNTHQQWKKLWVKVKFNKKKCIWIHLQKITTSPGQLFHTLWAQTLNALLLLLSCDHRNLLRKRLEAYHIQ